MKKDLEHWTKNDFVREHFYRALTENQDQVMKHMLRVFDAGFGEALESPLEAAFFLWWLAVRPRTHGVSIALQPQYEVEVCDERFRIDFVPHIHIVPSNCRCLRPGILKIAVELDGHDFHERTKDQVAMRDRRDRALQEAGWLVQHFSGSEFNRDPLKCVVVVHETARRVAVSEIGAKS